MAKKVSKMAIRIIPDLKKGKIVCAIYEEKALMKLETGKHFTDDDLPVKLFLQADDISTIVLHDEKVVSIDSERGIIIQ